MCAVATDGASVMTGKHKGVTTLLKQDNPFIIRTHCIAHRLALAAAQASHAIPYLDKFGEKLNQIYNYFHYSTKHKSKLTKIFSVLNMELRRQFVRPCDTRWLSVGGAVDAVLANLNPLIMCLSDDAYPNTGTGDATAVGLFKYVTTYQFLATLHFMSDVLKQLNFLSKTFQKSDSDCSIVYSHVTAKSDTFKNMKVNAGQRLLEFLNMVPNEPDETGKFYLKMFEVGKPVQPSFVLTLPEGAEGIAISDNQNYRKWFQSSREKYIDKLVSNLSDRFDDLGLLGAFKIFVPSNYPPTSSEEYKNYGEQEIDALCEHYGCERNGKDGRICKPVIDSSALKDEWPDVKGILSCNYRGMPYQATWQQILNMNVLSSYPNVSILAKISLIIPVSTADCERGFSRYNLIKTKLRASLKVSSVSCLMTLAIEAPPLRDMNTFNFHRAFQIWGMKNRRLMYNVQSRGTTADDVGDHDLMCRLLNNIQRLAKMAHCLGEDIPEDET
ncbi:E3 SUMO-protein ligase KIAA1586-like [Ptychodera flava]|uniref:E3 SUMO-protein ligase KIAA1586-like n=1 Tax=Ptychodera flava TaxID=63121 RepID=UPI00396A64AE